MQDALRHTGRAGRIEDLDDVVRVGPAREERLRVDFFFPTTLQEMRFKRRVALAVQNKDMLELGESGPKLVDHCLMVVITEGLRCDEDLALRIIEHEGQFALTENRHDRIGDCPDVETGKMQCGELPPVRKLIGNDLAFLNAEFRKADGNAPSIAPELIVGDRLDPAAHAVDAGDSDRIGLRFNRPQDPVE